MMANNADMYLPSYTTAMLKSGSQWHQTATQLTITGVHSNVVVMIRDGQ